MNAFSSGSTSKFWLITIYLLFILWALLFAMEVYFESLSTAVIFHTLYQFSIVGYPYYFAVYDLFGLLALLGISWHATSNYMTKENAYIKHIKNEYAHITINTAVLFGVLLLLFNVMVFVFSKVLQA